MYYHVVVRWWRRYELHAVVMSTYGFLIAVRDMFQYNWWKRQVMMSLFLDQYRYQLDFGLNPSSSTTWGDWGDSSREWHSKRKLFTHRLNLCFFDRVESVRRRDKSEINTIEYRLVDNEELGPDCQKAQTWEWSGFCELSLLHSPSAAAVKLKTTRAWCSRGGERIWIELWRVRESGYNY